MGDKSFNPVEFLSETKKLIAKATKENMNEYLDLIKKVKAESGEHAASLIAIGRNELVASLHKTQAFIQSDQMKLKVLEGQIAALTREIEALKKDSLGSADIAALKKRIDALEKWSSRAPWA